MKKNTYREKIYEKKYANYENKNGVRGTEILCYHKML